MRVWASPPAAILWGGGVLCSAAVLTTTSQPGAASPHGPGSAPQSPQAPGGGGPGSWLAGGSSVPLGPSLSFPTLFCHTQFIFYFLFVLLASGLCCLALSPPGQQ